MIKKQSPIRIKGLVRLMNRVREQLNAGIAPEYAAEFRHKVRHNVRNVEALCRKYHITPDDLPAPSRRAYLYLKGLDLDNLPEPVAGEVAPRQVTVRVTNVISNCEFFGRKLWDLATAAKGTTEWSLADSAIVDLSATIQADVATITALCEEQGGTPADLPVRSRRGYQWLAFVADPRNLLQQVTTLATLKRLYDDRTFRRHVPENLRALSLYVDLVNISALFRSRVERQVFHITIHEGFVDAPPKVLKSVLHAAVTKPKVHLERVRDYAATPAFTDVVVALEATTTALSANTQGRFYDLAEVFARVNATYFDGAIAQPQLRWNQTVTYRKLGHYDCLRDTVMISQTLDAAHIPGYVIDFVMYHELLHKSLGVNMMNGRRYAHTPEFRAAERAYPEFEKVDVFLEKELDGVMRET